MVIDDYRKHHPKFAEFDKLARDSQRLTDQKLDLMVSAGVITQDQADSMTSAMGGSYVPLKGFERVDAIRAREHKATAQEPATARTASWTSAPMAASHALATSLRTSSAITSVAFWRQRRRR
ncbi:MAG: hypothetical protein Q8O37_08505 [Sulfuricellaceae bacterium]|nr:hypothetical protein [Sulfuricellaceae bacterium]